MTQRTTPRAAPRRSADGEAPPNGAAGSTNGAARYLNFEVATTGDADPVVMRFTVGARVEEFRCLPQVPGIYLAEFIAATEAEMGTRLKVALEFMRGALEPDEEARFEEFLHSKTVMVPMEQIANIAARLVEAYAARPTGPSSD